MLVSNARTNKCPGEVAASRGVSDTVGGADMPKPTCSVEGCNAKAHARGWCSTHYNRWNRHGSTDDPRPSREERFWVKVDKSGDCWIWTGARHPLGYGNVRTADGGYEAAHRVSYRLLVGDIPDGLVLDHLCRTPECVNPEHLEPVTQKVNVLRGEGVTAQYAAQTHCKRSHPLSGDNLYVSPRGDRRCRACRKLRLQSRHGGDAA